MAASSSSSGKAKPCPDCEGPLNLEPPGFLKKGGTGTCKCYVDAGSPPPPADMKAFAAQWDALWFKTENCPAAMNADAQLYAEVSYGGQVQEKVEHDVDEKWHNW